MTIHTYNETFLHELERLNPAQREAVDAIEGPVLVIAGPGTGKTHILAARIGNILLKTDAQPHNILCLTFTDAGVQAMRQRLLSLIGPDAHKVHIFTFHSFCNTIIQDNLDRFGRRELEPLSDLERVEISRKLLDELPWEHPLRRGRSDGYFYENHLQNLFRQMKSENWTVGFIEKKIDEYLLDLPTRKEFIYQQNRGNWKKGDLKTAAIEGEQLKMERLRSAVQLFDRYEKLMHDARRYDYEDMILWVLRAFQEQPSLLARYQEQYLYFLLDEYQDTNGAQNEILSRLTEFWEAPNVFIVGDDDQSIYEFQGARLKNISDFYHTYHGELKVVVLTENYRSSQHILDTSGTLIDKNQIRILNSLKDLGLNKLLTARHAEFAELALRPVVTSYPNRLQEEVAIAEQLEKLMQEGFPLDEVAVIFAKHKQAKRLMAILGKKGIPYQTRQSVNALDLPLIQNLRLLLGYFHDEFHKPYSGEQGLFRILHFDFFGVKPQDLARLSMWLAAEGEGWTDGEKLPPRAGVRSVELYLRSTISNPKLLKEAGLEQPETLLQVADFLELMLAQYANLSLPVFVERVINLSGLLRNILDGDQFTPLGRQEHLQVLFAFTSFLEKETERNPRLSLSRLLEILKSMDANRIGLRISDYGLRNGPSTPPQSEIHNPQSAIQLLTSHSAKGLEFRRVFLLDCVKDNWEPSKRSGGQQFSFPDTLTLSGEADEEEARRRLFYVAMTRAKEALQMSYAEQGDDGKGLNPAIFVAETLEGTGSEAQPSGASPAALLETQAALLLENKPKGIEPHDREAVQVLLEKFTLSVSSLNKFLRCPLSFYYENVLRAPAVATEAAFYGTAMHDALRRGFEKMLRNVPEKRQFPFAGEFVQFFEQEMKRQQGFFSKKDFERRMALGRQYLHDYVAKHQHDWTKNCKVEQSFKNVIVEGVPIMGVIDRIDYFSKNELEAHIVDYKTGNQDSAKLKRPEMELAVRQLAVGSQFDSPTVQQSEIGSALPEPKNQKPETIYGGTYWRQLVFYKILFENWRNNPALAVSAEISYLEPDAKGAFTDKRIHFEPGDVAFVKNLIVDTYGKIMRQEFYEGCGEANCSWCNFLKNQQQVDSFAEVEIEELDD
ncbi:MAG: ATP-dependent helicase [Saprospiraceae bacterium]|nr:ATP-dependent helicase [Saprospiraceae bacterium]MCF8251974.1 ATP-dependent helicase [Saprospiraceae bacterium]MCF8281691.1 ATP-dependent helicase [Bacteroidales bacterium]MCF8313679.1 ATP-dependent helicase [Saprospiraceae bacterium]MCF8442386.1 ATP-dependent helicase [Saprospiraceae bacterium]